MKLVVTPPALAELHDAAAFYTLKAGVELGLALVAEFERTANLVLDTAGVSPGARISQSRKQGEGQGRRREAGSEGRPIRNCGIRARLTRGGAGDGERDRPGK